MDEKVLKEYELYKTFPNFNVFNVYRVLSDCGKREFLYKETRPNYNRGRKLKSKKEYLREVNMRLEQLNNVDEPNRKKYK